MSAQEKLSTDCPYARDGDYIYLGEFPMGLKAPGVEIGDTVDGRGYYLGSDGSWYARVSASPKSEDSCFSTGEKIVVGGDYFFKLEPIRWRLLFERDGMALLLSDLILASVAFQSAPADELTSDGGSVYANNYKNSEIRRWLLDVFLPSAFSEEEDDVIIEAEVDNGKGSMVSCASDAFASENTCDKVFLLSYSEITDEVYGLPSGKLGVAMASDYARATGAYFCSTGKVAGSGFWWTRSPASKKENCAVCVTNSAYYSKNESLVHMKSIGVVPAIRIKL